MYGVSKVVDRVDKHMCPVQHRNMNKCLSERRLTFLSHQCDNPVCLGGKPLMLNCF